MNPDHFRLMPAQAAASRQRTAVNQMSVRTPVLAARSHGYVERTGTDEVCHSHPVPENSRARKAKAVFERAVERELHAIERHEAAARQEEEAATYLEQQLADETDENRQHELRMHAAEMRARASNARARAAQVRQRLSEEGVETAE